MKLTNNLEKTLSFLRYLLKVRFYMAKALLLLFFAATLAPDKGSPVLDVTLPVMVMSAANAKEVKKVKRIRNVFCTTYFFGAVISLRCNFFIFSNYNIYTKLVHFCKFLIFI